MTKKSKTNFSYSMELSGKKQSLKSKKIEIEDYMIRYKKAKLKIECFEGLTMLNQNSIKEKEQLLSYTKYIEKVLELLSDESKNYFHHEYLVDNYNPLWWYPKYNKAVFIKIRNAALNEFLLYVR